MANSSITTISGRIFDLKKRFAGGITLGSNKNFHNLLDSDFSDHVPAYDDSKLDGRYIGWFIVGKDAVPTIDPVTTIFDHNKTIPIRTVLWNSIEDKNIANDASNTYALRKKILINSKEYAAYYAKKIEFGKDNSIVVKKVNPDSKLISTLDIKNLDDYNKDEKPQTAKNVLVGALPKVSLTGSEIRDYYKYKSPGASSGESISEIGLIAAIPEAVSGLNINGSTVTKFKELTNPEIVWMSKIDVFTFSTDATNYTSTIFYSLG